MSRVVFLDMSESAVVARCATEKVGISAIERLPAGGIRLVCMSGDGAELIRRKLKSHVLKVDAEREGHRPRTPLW
jgi:hypothetical protein